jgi:hypothetical protein
VPYHDLTANLAVYLSMHLIMYHTACRTMHLAAYLTMHSTVYLTMYLPVYLPGYLGTLSYYLCIACDSVSDYPGSHSTGTGTACPGPYPLRTAGQVSTAIDFFSIVLPSAGL